MSEHTFEQVSVVIITMDRLAIVERTLPILLNDPATGEVIVVVDGGEDGTMQMLERWAQRDSRVRPIWQENAGEGAARQRGAQEATFDVVVFLDDDVEPLVNLISQHARRHGRGDVELVLGYMPTTIPSPRRPGQVATILYASDYESACRLYEANPDNIWLHFWAGNFSIRRDRAVSVGLRGQLRFSYHEDLYFGIRCRELGVVPAFDRNVRARHTHSRNLRSLAREARRSGEARGTLMNWFPELVEHLDPLIFQNRFRRIAAVLLSNSSLRGIIVPALMATSWLSGHLRAWKLEVFAAQVMRQVELVHTYRTRMNDPIVPRQA